MSFELRFDKKKRAFTLSNGQYKYSNTVNDEVIKIVTLNTLPIQRRLYFCKDGFEKYIAERALSWREISANNARLLCWYGRPNSKKTTPRHYNS